MIINMTLQWYNHTVFNQFWNHYHHCHQWLKHNGHISSDNSVSSDTSHTVHQYFDTCAQLKSKLMDQLEDINENEINTNGDNSDTQHNQQFEITDEYLQFILVTKTHQMERKKLRESRIKNERKSERYVDISKVEHHFNRSCAPKRNHNELQINAKRNVEMRELYGDDANIIQGMEAALQLNFDRLCDLHQPKCWPVIPVRI